MRTIAFYDDNPDFGWHQMMAMQGIVTAADVFRLNESGFASKPQPVPEKSLIFPSFPFI
ncbi:hypothetical protein H5P28_14115 [Ruficoccus amylovorans]|uniref:Uncharacterized protein n=1 Tax=Ruficoccus amylovorans TaxID=1804625 RepID=A0A842HGH8_9BACT|nr:hypothetical protein [Ruficoccus amylovorans]MBC2595399.1 hypothetical protein [Ruficoccus amylovorans]